MGRMKRNGVFFDFCILNYDPWVEKGLGDYSDGFVKRYRGENIPDEYFVFDREIARSVPNNNRVNHLHGSVLFAGKIKKEGKGDAELCKWDDCLLDSSPSNQILIYSSEGLVILTPIITGRVKERCLCMEPYASYMYNLEGSMCEGDSLVVIGYGFGDDHVNKTIEHYGQGSGKRLVLISPYSQSTSDRVSELCGYSPEGKGPVWVSDDGMCVWFMMGFKSLATDPVLKDSFFKAMCPES